MASLIGLIIILVFSVLITKIAAVALAHTGLSKDSATFQARSAFTGVGFTTTEAEKVVKHPVRRKIIMTLMLIGNVGIISAIASLLLTFVDTDAKVLSNIIRLSILVFSLVLLWILSKSKWLENRLVNLNNKALERYTTIKK